MEYYHLQFIADFNRVKIKYISHPSASPSPYFKSIKYFPALKVQNLQRVSISGWFGLSCVVTKSKISKSGSTVPLIRFPLFYAWKVKFSPLTFLYRFSAWMDRLMYTFHIFFSVNYKLQFLIFQPQKFRKSQLRPTKKITNTHLSVSGGSLS